MNFKEYKEIIYKTWYGDNWGRIPRHFISTLNLLFAETLDDSIVYPKDLFFSSKVSKRTVLIFSNKKLYVIKFENEFHEMQSFSYIDVRYIAKREADCSIKLDLIIGDYIIQLDPLLDSNRSWEHKYHTYLIKIIQFLDEK